MATRKNSTDRIGWADLPPGKMWGGCSPIEPGEIDGFEACPGEGFHLIYDERTDTIFSAYWDVKISFGSAPDLVSDTLEQYGEGEL